MAHPLFFIRCVLHHTVRAPSFASRLIVTNYESSQQKQRVGQINDAGIMELS